MISIPHKAKQFLLVTVKLLIVTGALYYIYMQLQDDKSLNWNIISSHLSFQSIVILIGFSAANWILEIFKWQNLVSYFKEISFLESAKQSLSSLTVSIFTPNRIGEYGAKMMYYPKDKRKKIVFINFISNSSQMGVTCFFGVLGFMLSNYQLHISIIYYLISVVVLVGFALLIQNIEIYGFSIRKLVTKLKSFPRSIMLNNFQLSVLRYLVFSTQFLFLLLLFEVEVEILIALSAVFLMYFLASVVPSIHLLDVAIKGSVAVYLFGQLGIESWKVISITSLMWFFNLVLPVLIGSLFVLRFKPSKE
jgi:hypothetical protein